MKSKNTVADLLMYAGIGIGVLGLIGTMIIADDFYDSGLIFIIGIISIGFFVLMIFSLREIIVLLNENKDYMKALVTNNIDTGDSSASAAAELMADELPEI